MPRARRLVIVDAMGEPLIVNGLLLMIDLEGIPNANSQVPLRAVVQEQCDLVCWHDRTSGTDLPCWSD